MTIPTHAIFYIALSNTLNFRLSHSLIFGLIGAIIPDISNPIGLGRFIKPVSSFIELKYGHRTITHSWIFLLFSFFIAFIFSFYTKDAYFFVLGVFSHIILDMFNKSGVHFFYPEKLITVIPNSEELRIETGSKREKRFAFFLFIVAFITLPLGIYGYETTFRFIAGSHTAAVEEYKSLVDQYEVYVTVLKGINRITQEPIINKKFRVVASMPKKITLVEDEDGRRLTIGQAEDSIIETKKMRVSKGVPIKTSVVRYNNLKDLSVILNELESPYSYAIGTLIFQDKPFYLPSKETWEGIEISGNTVYLNYSDFKALSKLATNKLVTGSVTIRKEYSEEGIVSPLIKQVKVENASKIFFINTCPECLLIKEGEYITKGQIIAIDKEVPSLYSQIESLKASLNTKDIEEEKADALQDKSLSLKREIENLKIQIDTQKNIVEKTPDTFRESEEKRLENMEKRLSLLNDEYNEVKRSIEKQKEYIVSRKDALKKETELNIKSIYAKIETMKHRSIYTGIVKNINQRSPNVFEIEIQ